MERDKIIKAFECCAGIPNCNDCPLRPYPQNCKDRMERRVLNLIRELTKENEKLRGLYEHNSKLAIEAERKLVQYQKSYENELSRAQMLLRNAWESVEQKDELLGTIKYDTVKEMQKKLTDRDEFLLRADYDGIYYIDHACWVNQVAAEILGEE